MKHVKGCLLRKEGGEGSEGKEGKNWNLNWLFSLKSSFHVLC